MKCERCAFRHDCDGEGKELELCFEPSDEAIREEIEAQAVDRGDAKRKGYDD